MVKNKYNSSWGWFWLFNLIAVASFSQGSDQQLGGHGGGSGSDPIPDYCYDNLAAAKLVNHPVGTVFETKGFNNLGDGGGSIYIVFDTVDLDWIDGVGAFDNGDGYAVLQPLEGSKTYIEQYGAISDDNNADDYFIQQCLDWGLKRDNGITIIGAKSGVFDIDTGIIIALKPTAEFDFVTLHLEGNSPVYGISGDDATTFRVRNKEGFGLAIQKGRKCRVSNIRFLGTAPYPGNQVDLITWQDNVEWSNSGEYRNTTRSPYCGIVIDPFSAGHGGDEYPDFTSYYTSSSSGGSSMIEVVECGFDQLTVAVLISPSLNTRNGDNISINHCNSNRTKIFVASGQDQTRSNSIYNCYVLSSRTFIDGRSYGNAIGSLPSVDKCNIAGGSKYLYVTNSDRRASVKFSNVYAESMWCIGVGNGEVFFDQCELKFINTINYWRPTFLAETVNFKNCQIQYYGADKIPFPFADRVSIDGGQIEGGLIFRDYSNSGGERLNQIELSSVRHYHYGIFDNSSKQIRGIPESNLYPYPVLGGSSISSNYETEYNNYGSIYWFQWLGQHQVKIDTPNYRYYIIDSRGDEIYQIGDQLSTLESNFSTSILNGTSKPNFRAPLGVVKSISGDSIFLAGCPFGLTPGNLHIYVFDVPYLMRFMGIVTNGNDTIKSVITGGNSNIRVGRRINGQGVDRGTYVKSFGTGYVVMSRVANSTHGYQLYESAPLFAKLTDYPTNSGPSQQIHKRGDFTDLKLPSTNSKKFTCTNSGKYSSAALPSWLSDDPSTTNEIQQISLNDKTLKLSDGGEVKLDSIIKDGVQHDANSKKDLIAFFISQDSISGDSVMRFENRKIEFYDDANTSILTIDPNAGIPFYLKEDFRLSGKFYDSDFSIGNGKMVLGNNPSASGTKWNYSENYNVITEVSNEDTTQNLNQVAWTEVDLGKIRLKVGILGDTIDVVAGRLEPPVNGTYRIGGTCTCLMLAATTYNTIEFEFRSSGSAIAEANRYYMWLKPFEPYKHITFNEIFDLTTSDEISLYVRRVSGTDPIKITPNDTDNCKFYMELIRR